MLSAVYPANLNGPGDVASLAAGDPDEFRRATLLGIQYTRDNGGVLMISPRLCIGRGYVAVVSVVTVLWLSIAPVDASELFCLCSFKEGLKLVLFSKNLEQIDDKRDIVVLAAHILCLPLGTLVIFSLDLVLEQGYLGLCIFQV